VADDGDAVFAREHVAHVGEDHRIVVDVYDVRGRVLVSGYLVDVAECGQAGPDVDELRDARLIHQVPHGTRDERPVDPCGQANRGQNLD
jgi:hypothetical protein